MKEEVFNQILSDLHKYKLINEFKGKYRVYNRNRKYAYGTTPYDTFKKIIDEIGDVGENALVLGSSIGWFQIYIKYYLNINVIGIDLHELRYEFAKKIIADYELDGIELFLIDFNDFDLDNIDFIWMNNYTFSDDINYDKVYDKGITFVSYVKPNYIPEYYDIKIINGKVNWSANPIPFYLLKKNENYLQIK
jgi:hypothetical protein